MTKTIRKEEEHEEDFSLIVSHALHELQPLLSGLNSVEAERIPSTLIQLIKKTLGKVFLMEHHYTFEELIDRITQFVGIEKTVLEKTNSLHEEYMKLAAKTKKSESDVKKLEGLRIKIQKESMRHEVAQHIIEKLKNEETKDRIIYFCQGISTLQFSKRLVTSQEIMDLINEFVWIINYLTPHPKVARAHISVPKFGGENALAEEEKQARQALHTLMSNANRAIYQRDFAAARGIYADLVQEYRASPSRIKKEVYNHLFNLWFKIYSIS